MRVRVRYLLLLIGLSIVAGHVHAEIVRDPIGVNVSAARPMSLTVRFADSNNGLFTSDQALFCYRQLANGVNIQRTTVLPLAKQSAKSKNMR